MKTIKLNDWQIAAIEVALKEKAAKMADRESWDRLIKILEGSNNVSVRKSKIDETLAEYSSFMDQVITS